MKWKIVVHIKYDEENIFWWFLFWFVLALSFYLVLWWIQFLIIFSTFLLTCSWGRWKPIWNSKRKSYYQAELTLCNVAFPFFPYFSLSLSFSPSLSHYFSTSHTHSLYALSLSLLLFPYTTLFRSSRVQWAVRDW